MAKAAIESPFLDEYQNSQNDNSNNGNYVPNQQNSNNHPMHQNNGSHSIAISYHDNVNKIFGCKHYSRKCWLRAECCNEWFVCRFCHDETNEYIDQQNTDNGYNDNNTNNNNQRKPHKINRYSTKYIKCMQCGTEQSASEHCIKCSFISKNNKNDKEEKDDDEVGNENETETERYCFAKYYCDICKFYDDDQNKDIFHCSECGLCRLGKKEDYVHCKKCGCCLHNEYYAKHPCIENSLKSDCPICFTYLFRSRDPVTFFMPCGHPLHYQCLMQYVQVGNWRCPICRTAWNDAEETDKINTKQNTDMQSNPRNDSK